MRWLSATTPNEWQKQSQSVYFYIDMTVMKISQSRTNTGNTDWVWSSAGQISSIEWFVWPTRCLRQIFPTQFPNEWLHQSSRTEYKKGQTFYVKFFFFYHLRKSKIFNFHIKHLLCLLQSWLYVPICWRTSKITNNIKFGMFSSSLQILHVIKTSISVSNLIMTCHLVLRSTPRSCSCPSLHCSSQEWKNKFKFIQPCII